MTIQDLIYQNLDILLKNQAQKEEGLNMERALKIGAYVAAGVLRSRHKEQKEILTIEIEGVYGIVRDFYQEHFESFNNKDYENLKDTSLNLLRNPNFDQELESFIQSIVE